MEEAAVDAVLAEGLGGVALGEVGADEGAVGAFAQGLAGDRRQAGVDGLAVAALCGQLTAEGLKGVEAELVEALALDEHPVVIPVRQEVTGQRDLRERQVVARHPLVDDAARERLRLPQVHTHIGAQPHVRRGRIDGPASGQVEAPQG